MPTDDDRPHARRAAELLAKLTLEEKAALTAGHNVWYTPRIDRVGIPALKMSDGPSGVRGGTTGTRRSMAFPCGMAAGAAWDPALVRRLGEAIGDEARSKGVHVVLGPTVCIARTPLAGRTFESYAEDPHLSARTAVAWISGVQSRGAGCCVKHFACNDQEHERMTISAEVDERTLREVHLPSFEAAVREAGAWAVMSAYNKIDGVYCGEHPWLLGELLKGEWGFDGAVISDWGGTHSTIEAALAGLDIEMPGRPRFLGPKLAEAVEARDVPEAVLDDHATRVLRLMSRTGVLDSETPEETQDDDPARRAVAREVAIAGTVLLKNDGLLPIDGFRTQRIAVIGPNAAQLAIGGGGSSQVYPHRYVSFIDELHARLGDVTVVHEPGCALGDGLPPLPPRLLPDGLRLEYFANPDFEGEPAATDAIGQGNYMSAGSPVRRVPVVATSVRARGTFVPDATGAWQIGVANAGAARVLIDGAVAVENDGSAPGGFFFGMGSGPIAQPVVLEAGRAYRLTVELRGLASVPLAGFRLYAARPLGGDPIGRAAAAAAAADCAIVVVGAGPESESEGFDRKDLRLAGEQDELVRRVIAANPRTAVVVNCGAPVELPWADDAAAIMMLWYPGEEGASALADMLAGVAEPSGRLPITFPRRLEDTPAHDGDRYPGIEGKVVYGEGVFVGYRHYDANGIAPQFAFGHGLSYTTFDIGAPGVDASGATVRVSVPVTNTGARRGSEVVQLYVSDPECSVPRPKKELRAFAKLTLDAGASTTAVLDLDERAFAFWDEASHGWKTEPGAFGLHIGVSAADIRHTVRIER